MNAKFYNSIHVSSNEMVNISVYQYINIQSCPEVGLAKATKFLMLV